MTNWYWKASIASGLLGICCGAAQADELRYAIGLPAQHQAVDSQDAYRDALWTNVFQKIDPGTYEN